MRLINTQTLELEEFFDDSIPKYAILSHTWRHEEVLFRDWNDHEARKAKGGWNKIENACRQARHCTKANARPNYDSNDDDDAVPMYVLDYIWIDTVCIDKSSSAELSEAINSMYTWYEEAAVCFVYLDDFNFDGTFDRLHECRWFTRGWTLQELLAPDRIIAFDASWSECGRILPPHEWKSRPPLLRQFATITGIEPKYLTGFHDARRASVAERMSWAAERHTSRGEDMAYCLMGLFEVNMPLLYGEGKAAFIRLQEEIIKHSNDTSIFFWTLPTRYRKSWKGCLAPSVDSFAVLERRGPIYYDSAEEYDINDYSITNCGLRIKFPVLFCGEHGARSSRRRLVLAMLHGCVVYGNHPAILLESASEPDDKLNNVYARMSDVFMIPIAWAEKASIMNMTLIHERRPRLRLAYSMRHMMEYRGQIGLLPIYVQTHAAPIEGEIEQIEPGTKSSFLRWHERHERYLNKIIWLDRVEHIGSFVADIHGEWRTSSGKRISLRINVQVEVGSDEFDKPWTVTVSLLYKDEALLKQATKVDDRAQTQWREKGSNVARARPVLIEFPQNLESLA